MVLVTESAADVLRQRLADSNKAGSPIRVIFQGYG